jgi:hypothetical protein
MHGNSWVGRSPFVTATALCLATYASPVLAQPAIDPNKVEFAPSPSHSATSTDGTPLVQHYELGVYLSGATLPLRVVPLGKPAPGPDGLIRVDLTSVFAGWPVPGALYVADVAAVGPDGAARSAISNTFSFSAPCTVTVSPTSQNAAAKSGSYSVTVTAGTGCTWAAASNATWISLTSGTSGTGNGTVIYTVATSKSTTPRTGTLTIAGRTITVTQDPRMPPSRPHGVKIVSSP